MQKEQWKWCAKPSYSFSNNSQNNIRPIKASVETPPFPLFQNPKLEETPADGVIIFRAFNGHVKNVTSFELSISFNNSKVKLEISLPLFLFIFLLNGMELLTVMFAFLHLYIVGAIRP